MSRRTAPDARARRGRRHLELAPEIDEWPDDLLTLLGQARQGYLAAEPTPQPSPAVAAFMQVPDQGAVEAMRLLAARGIVSGESGAAGLAALLLAAQDPDARESLGLSHESRVLLFSCEGATDPELYARLVAH